jgi:hypothetical protein
MGFFNTLRNTADSQGSSAWILYISKYSIFFQKILVLLLYFPNASGKIFYIIAKSAQKKCLS